VGSLSTDRYLLVGVVDDEGRADGEENVSDD
jgi:hypothetical protein